jgi:MFS family permease
VADRFQLSFREVFGVAVGLMIVGLVLMALKYPSHAKSEPTASSSLKRYVKQAFTTDRRLRTFAYLSALDWSLWGLSFPFYHIFIYKQFSATIEQLGIVVAIGSASPALASFLLGPVLDRARPTRFLVISEFMALGAFLPILLGGRVEMAYLSAVFWGLVYGLWMPAMNSYVLDTVGNDSFARASGNVSLLASLLSIPSPAIAGWFYDNVSPKAPFVITMIGALSTGVLILLLMREPKSQDQTFASSLVTSRSYADEPEVVLHL